MNKLINLGIEFNRGLESFREPFFTTIFEMFALLGSSLGYILMISTILWAFSPRLGLKLFYGVLFCNLINTFIKEFIQIERPFLVDPSLNALDNPSTFSFPSGHAQLSAFFWAFLALQIKSHWIRAIAMAFILLTGFSRVYLGVHYFFDVVVGWTLGLFFVFLFFKYSSLIDFLESKIKSIIWGGSVCGIVFFLLYFIPTKHIAMTLGGLFGLFVSTLGGRAYFDQFGSMVDESAKVKALVTGLGFVGVSICLAAASKMPNSSIGLFFVFGMLAFWVTYGLPQFSIRLFSDKSKNP